MSKIVFGFIGLPGSGKSTQAKMLGESLGCPVLNIGAELRASANPSLQKIMDSGELVPDSYVFEIIEEKLAELSEDGLLVLDGFFRRTSEVVEMAEKERKLHLQIGGIFYLQTSDEVVRERLSKRGRSDDGEDMETRLNVFKRERDGILEVLEEEKVKVIPIGAGETIDHVHAEVLAKLGREINKHSRI